MGLRLSLALLRLEMLVLALYVVNGLSLFDRQRRTQRVLLPALPLISETLFGIQALQAALRPTVQCCLLPTVGRSFTLATTVMRVAHGCLSPRIVRDLLLLLVCGIRKSAAARSVSLRKLQ